MEIKDLVREKCDEWLPVIGGMTQEQLVTYVIALKVMEEALKTEGVEGLSLVGLEVAKQVREGLTKREFDRG